jgi:hypothetical protein
MPASLAYPERRLTLSRQITKIPIGRSSSVETKNLLAAPDNAWFNCPVMSRNHAELEANFENKASTSPSDLPGYPI